MKHHPHKKLRLNRMAFESRPLILFAPLILSFSCLQCKDTPRKSVEALRSLTVAARTNRLAERLFQRPCRHRPAARVPVRGNAVRISTGNEPDRAMRAAKLSELSAKSLLGPGIAIISYHCGIRERAVGGGTDLRVADWRCGGINGHRMAHNDTT